MNDSKVKIMELDLNDILPNRFQPRIKFNEDSIFELSESIKLHGVLQPIIVRPISDKYEIVVGERRYKAAVLAEMTTIPARVVDLDDKASIEVALIENLQRKDLNPMEEAISYKKTLNMGYMTQEQLASKLGKSQSSIANKIRLLNLCDDVQEALMEEKISERHARSLLKVENEKSQEKLLNRIIDERLTVRKLDDIIKNEFIGKSEEEISEEAMGIVEENKKNIEELESKVDLKHKDENNNKIKSENLIDSKDDKIEDSSDVFSFPDEATNEKVNLNIDDIFSEETDKKDEKIEIIEEEKKQEDKEENGDKMNNMQNIEGEISFNTVKNQGPTSTGGRFFNSNILDDVEKEENKLSTPESQGFVTKDSPINEPQTPSIFTNSMNVNNLMTPQSQLSSTSNIPNSPTSIFGNIGIQQDNQNESNYFKESTISTQPMMPQPSTNSQNPNEQSIFSSFMTNNNSNEQIDKTTLNNFLDPTYIDGEKQENLNSNNSIDEQVFAKFIDPDYGGDISETKNNIGLENLLRPEVDNSSLSFDSSKNLDVEENNNLGNDVMLSGMSQINLFNPVSKPDLLAPMDENKSSTTESSNQTSTSPFNQILDQVYPKSESKTKQETINNDVIPVIQAQPELTLDDSLNKFEKVEESTQEEIKNSDSDSLNSSIFITSSEPIIPTAPVTPIIENASISNFLSVEDNQTEQSNLISEPADNMDQIISKNDELATTTSLLNDVDNSIETQPIIITDYTKQYDPILPTDIGSKEPVIDFKSILNMIRELNDKIESAGYEIDTEEIDLQDIYQVIINITKNKRD